MSAVFRAGYVALVGRPNVGKSSMLNRVLGQKLSITSDKAQTTRAAILGIHNTDTAQLVFIDTPGFQTRRASNLHTVMNNAALQALEQADVIVWVVDALRLGPDDKQILARLPAGKKVLVVLNKADTVKPKAELLPLLQSVSRLGDFAAVVPVSAKSGWQIDGLVSAITDLLPEGDAIFQGEEITDRSERYLAAEILREKLMRSLGEEIPYNAGVEIEQFEMQGKLRRIAAAILIKREGQKAIIIGQGGERLKKISTQARKDMESLFGGKVFLEVWVKVREHWDEDRQMLKRMGYL